MFGLIVHELARLERQSARPAIGRRHAKIGSAIGELVEDSECFSTSVEDVREHEGIRMRCASENMYEKRRSARDAIECNATRLGSHRAKKRTGPRTGGLMDLAGIQNLEVSRYPIRSPPIPDR